MESRQGQSQRRAAARRAARKASIGVESLEGRALLAQTVSVPGLGPLTFPTLTMLNPQQLVLNLTPTLASATTTTTSTTVTSTSPRIINTNARATSRTSIVFSGFSTLPATRTFSFQTGGSPILHLRRGAPTNLRLIAAPAGQTTVVVSTSSTPTPLAAAGPRGPLALHGHHGPQHHQHAGSSGHHGPLGR